MVQTVMSQLKPQGGAKAIIVSCDPSMQPPANELVPWLRKQAGYRGIPVILLADPSESGPYPITI